MHQRTLLFALLTSFVVSSLVTGCDRPEKPKPETTLQTPLQEAKPQATESFKLNQWAQTQQQLALNDLDTAYNTMEQLSSAWKQFVQKPNQEGLQQLQQFWQQSYFAFLKGRSYFLPSEIKTQKLAKTIHQWPIEPGYLDSLPDFPNSGIVNDVVLDITAATLWQEHGLTHPYDASLGYYPLAFELFYIPGENSTATRSVADFTIKPGMPERKEKVVKRRQTLVQLQIEQLTHDLEKWIQLIKGIQEPRLTSFALNFWLTGMMESAQFCQSLSERSQAAPADRYDLFAPIEEPLSNLCKTMLISPWRSEPQAELIDWLKRTHPKQIDYFNSLAEQEQVDWKLYLEQLKQLSQSPSRQNTQF